MWNLSKRHLSIWKTEHIFPLLDDGSEIFCVFFQIDRRLVPDFHFLSNHQCVLKPGYALEIGLLGATWCRCSGVRGGGGKKNH